MEEQQKIELIGLFGPYSDETEEFAEDLAALKKLQDISAMQLTIPARKRRLGIANGEYMIPDDIDGGNDEIVELFGVGEA